MVFRRMLRIQWVEKLSNERVLEKVRIKGELLNNIMARQLRFIRHVLREGEIEKRVAEGEITGKKQEVDRDKRCWTIPRLDWRKNTEGFSGRG